MELKEAIEGTWVTYKPSYKQKGEIGRIKSTNNIFIFVVYHCDGNWDDYTDYTAEATRHEDLQILNK